jgi:DNA-binding NarL/FixJ family response regulator
LAVLANAELWLGRLDRAAEHSDAAAEAAGLAGNPQTMVPALAVLCWTETLRGDSPKALSAGERAVGAHAEVPSGLFGWLTHCCYGLALVEFGSPARGAAEILEHVGGAELSAVDPSFRAHWYEVLVRAELGRRRIERAREWARRARAAASEFPLPGRVAQADLAEARVRHADGDAQRAAVLATSARVAFRRQGQSVDAGRTAVVAARAHADAGRPEAAVQLLEAAQSELGACGAVRSRAEALRELKRLGRPAHKGHEAARLSEREREVTALVGQGLTNKQIAAELVLSERTVERHLSRIFQKLGVSSRTALAGVAQRGGADSLV